MKTYACPSCGAAIPFRSNVAVYAVCPYCRTMVVRHDIDVQSIGTMAALPEDMSPFQIGTEGIYKGIHFGIVGRMRLSWEDGAWNEWFIISDDGRRGWLAEAQGAYAVSYEQPPDADALSTFSPILGATLNLDGQRFEITDIKEATCVGSEGELPFTAPQGRKTTSIDLTGADKAFASIEIEDGQKRLYIGSYIDWPSLQCKNYRTFDGW